MSLEQRFRTWIWPALAANSDAPLVCAIRDFIHWLTELLHAENHDFRTNGEARLLQCLGSTATVILDVGANQGNWALEAHQHCPNAQIYCFDIATPVREALRSNVTAYDCIHVVDYGLLDRSGHEKVKYYPGRDVVTSIYDFPHPEQAVWRQEEVRTGDSFVEEYRVNQIDLLKVDAEGADFQILKGFEQTLSQGKIAVIQFEYGYACVLSRKLLIDFYEYLEPKGYLLGKLHSKFVEFRPYQLKHENFFGPNYVAVHRSYEALVAQLAKPS